MILTEFLLRISTPLASLLRNVITKPTLDFPRLNFITEENAWRLKNIGRGTAEKIRFGQIGYDDQTKSHNLTPTPWLYFSLQPGSELILTANKDNLPIVFNAHVLVATYTDHKNNVYITYCRCDTNHLFKKVAFGKWEGDWKDISRNELNNIYAHLHKSPQRRDDWKVLKG
jgi:hypothetical protein